MSQSIRDTQRVPRSCIECTRRKIKCSKTIPCTACVRRGESLSCAREIVRVNGKFKIAVDETPRTANGRQYEDLENENKGLHSRIQHLEALLLQKEQQSPRNLVATPNPESSSEVSLPQDDILHSFQGLHVDTPPSSQNLPADEGLSGEELLMLLPIRKSSEQITRFSLESLGWIHCALNAQDFMGQHERFWDALHPQRLDGLEDHSWMALYLSVLCVGSYFMCDEDADEIHFLQEGFSGHRGPVLGPASNQSISEIWYDAVLKELHHADFLGKTSLSTIQTIAILSLVHRNFGQATREYALLGVAINTTRALNMDRLGHEEPTLYRPSTGPQWADRKTRELGRRLWWTLTICDWMMMPIRPSSITPGTFNTALSIESDGSHRDIILNSGNAAPFIPYSPLSYHLAVARVATIVQPYRNRTNPVSVEGISKSIQDLDLFDQTLPPHLSMADDSVSSVEPMYTSWIKTQRNLLVVLIESCRLTLCLAALQDILDTNADPFNLQYIGRQAAMKIIEQRRKEPSEFFAKFWGPRVGILSAGIYLVLDLLCFRAMKSLSEIETSLENVSFALQVLKNGAEAGQFGSQILERLLQLFHSWTADRVITKQMLLGVMAFAAHTPASQDQRPLDESSLHVPPDPRWSPHPQSGSTTQNAQLFDYGVSQIHPNGESIPELDLDFDGFDFDMFQHLSDSGMDWSTNALPHVFFGGELH